MTRVSGLPLDMALARLREAGHEDVRVVMTRGRRECPQGNIRALRFQDGTLLAAVFPPALTREEGNDGGGDAL